ncbi:DJ-1/PfpI family protein [Orbus sturtevantii]|uniref:DJ-1/PfpI family protein n=1 Tax=Orbus sturtevantii TaxID=3074109 RepID=UPI00370DC749
MNIQSGSKKEVIFLLLNQFADFEMAYLTSAINIGVEIERQQTPYIAKTVSIDGRIVQSIGGIKVVPDYSLATLPENYAALVLIGGYDWFNPDTKKILPLISASLRANKIVAAICNATVFLAINGFLNKVKHTSNALDLIVKYDTENQYVGHSYYMQQPVVDDHNIITANGFASLEFTKQLLLALHIDSKEKIEAYYHFFKYGLYCRTTEK